MGRNILAVVLGLVLGMVLIFAIELLGFLVYPPPPGLNFNDPQAVAEFVAGAPVMAFLLVLLAYLVGTLAGSWLAAWLSSRAKLVCGLIVGAVLLGLTIQNMRTLPHPLWFWALAITLLPLTALAGAALGKFLRPAGQPG